MRADLEALQKKIYAQQVFSAKIYDKNFDPKKQIGFDTFSFTENDGYYQIYFYGSGYDEKLHMPDNFQDYETLFEEKDEDFAYESTAFADLLALIIQHPEKIILLRFDGPDQGANGTKEWDFTRVVNSGVVFSNLKEFKVQLNDVGNHNTILLGMHHDPNPQQVSQLLLMMPNIVSIEIPAVPDAAFFEGCFPRLEFLKVQANYDHFNFIANLAKSDLRKQLVLDYTDCLHTEDESDQTEINAFEQEETAKLAAKMKEGFTEAEAKIELEKQELKDAGISDEEIQLDLYEHNREETLRLLKMVHKNDPEAVQDEMEYYESIEKWDKNGQLNPVFEEPFYEDDFEAEYEISASANKNTPFADYLAFVKSLNKGHFSFHLRENQLSKEQLFKLQKANKNMQFLHIPTQMGSYVSHKMEGL
ncbi:MAG: hypothetical protein NWQ38_07090 [Cellulophaga sp.]|nr:hypothetical protein [Cellulophaga sp.]